MTNKNTYLKLINVQSKLKAPKGQFNSFGKYRYRSCEDILEALKPVLKEENATVFIKDDVVLVDSRYYIKATVVFVDCETGESIEATGLAREENEKKGMDGSQITGTASSYARKYALNGLFLIDDTKDADTDEFKNQQNATQNRKQNTTENKNVPSKSQLDFYVKLFTELKTLNPKADEEKLFSYLSEKNNKTINATTIKEDIKTYNIVISYIKSLIAKLKENK